jgi:DNA modification methylase
MTDPRLHLTPPGPAAVVADPTTVPAVWWRLEDLDPWQENPRTYTREAVESLKALILAHGFNTVIGGHWPTRRIVRGHRRRLALQAIWKADPDYTIAGAPGPGYVPVRFRAGIWDGQAGAEGDALGDNRAQEDGAWDLPVVGQLMERWKLEGATLDQIAASTGFREAEIREIVAQVSGAKRPSEIPAPEAPGLPRTADSKPGTIYELGPHRLLCGDCTDLDQVARLMDGKRAATVLTDPPFAIYGSSTGLDSSIADDKVVRPFFALVLRSAVVAVRPFGSVYVCCDWRSWAAWWDSAKPVKLAPANLLIWDKGGGGLGSNYANGYELIGYFLAKPERTKMFKATTGVRAILRSNLIRVEAEGDAGPERGALLEWVDAEGNVVELLEGETPPPNVRPLLKYGRVTGAARVHNAAKPIPLLTELVEASTKSGELVVDFFGGSGTTLLTCARTERVAALTEIDPAWCDVIRHRWTLWAREAGQDPGPGALVMADAPTVLGAAAVGGPQRTDAAKAKAKAKGQAKATKAKADAKAKARITPPELPPGGGSDA